MGRPGAACGGAPPAPPPLPSRRACCGRRPQAAALALSLAPVAGGVADTQQDGLVLAAGLGQGLRAPGVPEGEGEGEGGEGEGGMGREGMGRGRGGFAGDLAHHRARTPHRTRRHAPVHQVVGMLQQVGRLLGRQAIGRARRVAAGGRRCRGRHRGGGGAGKVGRAWAGVRRAPARARGAAGAGQATHARSGAIVRAHRTLAAGAAGPPAGGPPMDGDVVTEALTGLLSQEEGAVRFQARRGRGGGGTWATRGGRAGLCWVAPCVVRDSRGARTYGAPPPSRAARAEPVPAPARTRRLAPTRSRPPGL